MLTNLQAQYSFIRNIYAMLHRILQHTHAVELLRWQMRIDLHSNTTMLLIIQWPGKFPLSPPSPSANKPYGPLINSSFNYCFSKLVTSFKAQIKFEKPRQCEEKSSSNFARSIVLQSATYCVKQSGPLQKILTVWTWKVLPSGTHLSQFRHSCSR